MFVSSQASRLSPPRSAPPSRTAVPSLVTVASYVPGVGTLAVEPQDLVVKAVRAHRGRTVERAQIIAARLRIALRKAVQAGCKDSWLSP